MVSFHHYSFLFLNGVVLPYTLSRSVIYFLWFEHYTLVLDNGTILVANSTNIYKWISYCLSLEVFKSKCFNFFNQLGYNLFWTAFWCFLFLLPISLYKYLTFHLFLRNYNYIYVDNSLSRVYRTILYGLSLL